MFFYALQSTFCVEKWSNNTLFSVVNSGWIASISMLRVNLAVAVVMMVAAGFFTVNAVLGVILLKMVGGSCSPNLSSLMLDYRSVISVIFPHSPRSTLSTEGQVRVSPRPIRSSPRESWQIEQSRLLQQMQLSLLPREPLAGVVEIRLFPAALLPQSSLFCGRHDKHLSTQEK